MKELTGNILRMEYSSIHDGPGLRTVLFLKGCPLRCRWCSTPESQSPEPEHGYQASRCRNCGKCADLCQQKALTLREGRIVRDKSRCVECGTCVFQCPAGAFKPYGYRLSVTKLMQYVLKDELFFFHSGGGVTISGGEVMAQTEFAAEVLRQCRENGIHTAIETSLYGTVEQVDRILPHLNLLMVDLKHMGAEQHRFWTGVDNSGILRNILHADEAPYEMEIRVRIPLIPGVNDGDENLRAAVIFCNQLRKLTAIEILPYHELGTETYRNLEKPYEMECEPMTQEAFSERLSFLRSCSPKVPVISEGE